MPPAIQGIVTVASRVLLAHSNSDVKLPVAQIEMISFLKNLALMGAMLFIIPNGAGPMSVDGRLVAKESK